MPFEIPQLLLSVQGKERWEASHFVAVSDSQIDGSLQDTREQTGKQTTSITLPSTPALRHVFKASSQYIEYLN